MNDDLKPEPKHPFVEMVVIDSAGVPLNTFCGENAPLAKILNLAAQITGPVKSIEALMPLAQSIYLVEWDYAKAYIHTYVDKSPKDVEDMLKAMPEMSKYYFVVSI